MYHVLTMAPYGTRVFIQWFFRKSLETMGSHGFSPFESMATTRDEIWDIPPWHHPAEDVEIVKQPPKEAFWNVSPKCLMAQYLWDYLKLGRSGFSRQTPAEAPSSLSLHSFPKNCSPTSDDSAWGRGFPYFNWVQLRLQMAISMVINRHKLEYNPKKVWW